MRAIVMASVGLLSACDHVIGLRELPDAAVVPPDEPDPLYVVPHVPDPIALGRGDFVLDGGTIDTATYSIGGVQPEVHNEPVTMTSTGPAMLVRARSVRLSGTITVRGDKPLIVLAQTITITGVLDASANASVDGPGASTQGGGAIGGNINTNNAGSGGGSFGGAGAAGGTAGHPSCSSGLANAGPSGTTFGDAMSTVLEGGGRGGNGGGDSGCTTPGGGGGGAIQLSAVDEIAVDGTIDVGGGGGSGGVVCSLRVSHAGAGGGAGGTIYLDAPTIKVAGTLAANGGGGGGGGSTQPVGGCATTVPGQPGSDATSTLTPALGGPGAEQMCSRAGGTGATGTIAASVGGSLNCDGAAGGGGGGVGRIVLRGTVETTNVITPDPVMIPRSN